MHYGDTARTQSSGLHWAQIFAKMNLLFIFLLISAAILCKFVHALTDGGDETKVTSPSIPDEKWGYVNVRPKAFMFWWLYGAQTKNPADRTKKPLIMWLQGGPGESSTGFGNFLEIGPQDVRLNKRNTTWVKLANVLFVDNPVGAGYSYVTDDSAYTRNISDISSDLLTFFKAFLKEMPVFQSIPFYMMGESYGGKMISAFGKVLHDAIHSLHDAIHSGEVRCNFKGVALGDSAISIQDSVLMYGSYLRSLSLLDDKGKKLVDYQGSLVKEAAEEGDYKSAFDYWKAQCDTIVSLSDNVYFYNVMYHNTSLPGRDDNSNYSPGRDDNSHYTPGRDENSRYVQRSTNGTLSELMNGPIRKKLGIIPDDVIWGSQSADVLKYQYDDVVSPVISKVGFLINAGYHVVIYQGQLDLICPTTGAELWMKKLMWPGLERWLEAPRKPLYPPSGVATKNTGAFLKQYQNVQFYYILKAGHFVPIDAPDMAHEMVRIILESGTSSILHRAYR